MCNGLYRNRSPGVKFLIEKALLQISPSIIVKLVKRQTLGETVPCEQSLTTSTFLFVLVAVAKSKS